MPARLKVVGVVYCLLGAWALLNMLLAFWAQPAWQLRFEAFMLPVGIGLLHGRRSSRNWATFWAIYTLTVLVGLAALFVVGEASLTTASIMGATLPATVTATILVVSAMACLLVLWVLYTPPVSHVFRRTRADAIPEGSRPA